MQHTLWQSCTELTWLGGYEVTGAMPIDDARFRSVKGAAALVTRKCNAVQCSAMQCNAMQCNAMQCNAGNAWALHCAALHWAALHSKAWQVSIQNYEYSWKDAATSAGAGRAECAMGAAAYLIHSALMVLWAPC